MTWTVHKFGGTSVADASCIRRVAGIIGGQSRDNNLAVVVSAMKGVTDDLHGLVDKAAKRQPVDTTLKALRARHEKANVELLGAGAAPIMEAFDKDLADIESILKALALVRAASNRSRDLVSGYGEIWSARQIAAFFTKEAGRNGRDVMFLNARVVLVI